MNLHSRCNAIWSKLILLHTVPVLVVIKPEQTSISTYSTSKTAGKNSVVECILNYIAYFECRFNKNSLLLRVFLAQKLIVRTYAYSRFGISMSFSEGKFVTLFNFTRLFARLFMIDIRYEITVR